MPTKRPTRPRIAPPKPKKSDIPKLVQQAEDIDVSLMPWQVEAYTYVEALDSDGKWLYPEVCIVAGRQNGKTHPLVPLIVRRLRALGSRIIHTAHNRDLPREVFDQVAQHMREHYGGEYRNIRYANGQEAVLMKNGGSYRLVAPNAGARGRTTDLVIVDETRELDDYGFIAAASPTSITSQNEQTIYLSNAGDASSVVLNALRARAGQPGIAYIEYSADPDGDIDDRKQWRKANPALGSLITMAALERARARLPVPIFEVEHLCRWQASLLPRMVSDAGWQALDVERRDPAARAALGVCVDPEGRRASIAAAWRDGARVYTRLLYDEHGAPISPDEVGALLEKHRKALRSTQVGFEPWTDKDVTRSLTTGARPLAGADAIAAGERFVRMVELRQLVHDGSPALAADLAYTVRRGPANKWYAVPADAARPTTASLATLRAAWLASAPAPRPPRAW